MGERAIPVSTVQVHYFCDTCGEPMKPTGMVYVSNPPLYPHRCIHGHNANLDRHYPAIEYRPVDQAAAGEAP